MAYVLLGLRYLLLIILYVFILRVVVLIFRDLKSTDTRRSAGQFQGDLSNASTNYGGALVVINSGATGVKTGDKRPFSEMLTIGRGDDSDLTIGDNFTSGQHARIYWMKDNYWIEDLGSTNGTYVNGHRITKETMLINGDQIKIGSVTFQFVRWEHAVQ